MKTNKIIIALCTCFLSIFSVNAANIDVIEAVDTKTIEASISPDGTVATWVVDGEIKVLKDISIEFSSRDFNDLNKILIYLWDDLEVNSSYSLIGIFWADWNIDFTVWDILEWSETTNSVWSGQWIIRLVVADSRTLEVYFNEAVENDEFEFKLLNELVVESLSSSVSNKVLVTLGQTMKVNSDYIFMVLSMDDAEGNNIVFEEDLYDFSTPDTLVDNIETLETDLLKEQLEKEVEQEAQEEFEDIALNAAETPDTWAETWVLIMLTFMINTGIYIRKKLAIA